RDVIEDEVNINGIVFRFIDTAGIRETTDQIETMGIAKTFQKVDQAQVVLYLTDAVGDSEEKIQQMLDKLQERISGEQKELFVIANKVDKSKASNDVIPVEIKDKYQKI